MMGKVLIRIIVDVFAALELAEDEDVNPDFAVQLMEVAAATLQDLSEGEKSSLIQQCAVLADEAEAGTGPNPRSEYIRSFCEYLGVK